MADKRKLSVEEMLAAARAEKLGGSAAPAKPAAQPAELVSTPLPAETPLPNEPVAADTESEVAKPAVKPVSTKGMSVADMLAAARGEKTGAPKPAAPAAPKPAAAKAEPKPAAAVATATK